MQQNEMQAAIRDRCIAVIDDQIVVIRRPQYFAPQGQEATSRQAPPDGLRVCAGEPPGGYKVGRWLLTVGRDERRTAIGQRRTTHVPRISTWRSSHRNRTSSTSRVAVFSGVPY